MTYPSIIRRLFITVALALLLAAMHFAAPVLVPLGLAALRPRPAAGDRDPGVQLVGARCSIALIQWLFIGITAGTCNMRPTDTHRATYDACPPPLLPSRPHMAANSRSFWQRESSP